MDGLASAVTAAAEDGSLAAAIDDEANTAGSEPLPGQVAVTGSVKATLTSAVDPEKANLNAAIAIVSQMLEVHAALRLRVRTRRKCGCLFWLLVVYVVGRASQFAAPKQPAPAVTELPTNRPHSSS
jgi:hypothetical protein